MDNSMITTAFELPGFKVARSLGIVRGLTVDRGPWWAISWAASSRSSAATSPSTPSSASRRGRKPFQEMRQHAQALRANAIIGVHYDATEVMPGLTEVLCYGTAVVVEPGG
jgi:uncharacterized protein YbjQ (UPF0145 family)